MIRYRTASIDSVTLFYREAGSIYAPAILLLHGFPSSSHMFRELIPRLADRFHVVAPDLPGFGFSDAPPRSAFPYTFAHLSEVIDRFTEVVGLSRYALYVFDYGAPVGFRLAVAHPERVTAIVTQNGNAYLDGLSQEWNPIQAYWSAPTPANRAALRAFLEPGTTRFQYVHGVSDESLIAPESYTLDAALLARPGNDEIQLDLFLDYRSNVLLYPTFQEYLRTSRPPVLAVWGKNDPFFLPAGAEAFRRDQPEAELRFYDTGHFALETHVAEVADAIRDFLTRKLPQDGDPITQTSSVVGQAILGTEPIDMVRRFYDALARGDLLALVGSLSPRLDWTEAERFPYYGGTWHTPQAVVEGLLTPLGRDWEDFAARPASYVTEGQRVVSLGSYCGRYRKTGRSMTAPFAHVWTVREGKIVGFVQYTDTAKVLEAMEVESR